MPAPQAKSSFAELATKRLKFPPQLRSALCVRAEAWVSASSGGSNRRCQGDLKKKRPKTHGAGLLESLGPELAAGQAAACKRCQVQAWRAASDFGLDRAPAALPLRTPTGAFRSRRGPKRRRRLESQRFHTIDLLEACTPSASQARE